MIKMIIIVVIIVLIFLFFSKKKDLIGDINNTFKKTPNDIQNNTPTPNTPIPANYTVEDEDDSNSGAKDTIVNPPMFTSPSTPLPLPNNVIDITPIDCVGEWSQYSSCPSNCILDDMRPYEAIRRFIVRSNENDYGECPLRGKVEYSNCPVNRCIEQCVGTWNEWEKCPNKCYNETDDIDIVHRTFNGTCSNLIETSNCPRSFCPVDCKGEWTEFDNCPSCINKNETVKRVSRKYRVNTPELHDGFCSLRGSVEYSNCPLNYCPVDCKGEWTEFDTCPEECIMWNEERSVSRRFIASQEAQHSGSNCPDPKVETSNCPATNICPVDCDGTWSEWSTCPSNCINENDAVPKVSRNFILSETAKNIPLCAEMDNKVDYSNCPVTYCPVDCVGDWSPYDLCPTDIKPCIPLGSPSPPPDTVNRHFVVNQDERHGGECPLRSVTQQSNCSVDVTYCPIDCKGEWGEWSVCSNMCNENQISNRTYHLTRSNQFGGRYCDYKGVYVEEESVDESNCPFTPCPINCKGEWGAWDDCPSPEICIDKNAVIPTVNRYYSVTEKAKYGGSECEFVDEEEEVMECPYTRCPIDCKGEWGEWSECKNKCNEMGDTTRTYTVTTSNEFGGSNCKYNDGEIETSNCPFTNCSIDCHGQWSDWADICPDKCIKLGDKVPVTQRYYNIYLHPKYGGSNCEYNQNDSQDSNCTVSYCPINCEGEWGDWDRNCDPNACDNYEDTVSRTYRVTTSNQFNGFACSFNDGEKQSSNCPFKHCPIDCRGEWSEWDQCRNRCDESQTIQRQYTVTRSNQFDGFFCNEKGKLRIDGEVQTSNCPFEKCPIDCRGEWSGWESCPTPSLNTCVDFGTNILMNTPVTQRYYNIYSEAQNGGSNCEYTDGEIQRSNCLVDYCPIDCEGEWGRWNTTCSNLCGSNQEVSRTFSLKTSNQFGGRCDFNEGDVQTSNCPYKPCAVDCIGEWSDWDECRNRCDNMQTTRRSYIVTQSNQYGGNFCKNNNSILLFNGDIELSNCPFKRCSIDCEGEWGDWISCPTECIHIDDPVPTTQRKYSVYLPAQHGGSQCPHIDKSTENSNCPVTYCPIDCVGEWSDWSPGCSNQCNSNQTITRKYIVTRSNQFGGRSCLYSDNYEETSNCPYLNCPIHCEGEWITTDQCSTECENRQSITSRYMVTRSNQFGGDYCRSENNTILMDGNVYTSNCPFEMCGVDCKGEWIDVEPCPQECYNGTGEIPRSKKSYNIIKPAQFGGSNCKYKQGELRESNCTINYCPIDCEGVWDNWNTTCSNLCDSNQEITRKYRYTRSNQYGGLGCMYNYKMMSDGEVETSNCPFVHCPVDCEGEWVAETCDNMICDEKRTIKKTYTVTRSNVYGGNYCTDEAGTLVTNNAIQYSNCPVTECNRDCVGVWSEWENCTSECVDSKTTIATSNTQRIRRIYNVITPQSGDGQDCPHFDKDIEESNCQVKYCPINCQGYWSDWNKTCDTTSFEPETLFKTYIVTQSNQYGGNRCEHNFNFINDGDKEYSNCPEPTFPVDCVGEWGSWIPCTNSNCGERQSTYRTYNVIRSNVNKGASCTHENKNVYDNDIEYSNCPFSPCSNDCVGRWSDWETCPHKCLLEGQQSFKSKRFYDIITPAAHGGEACEFTDGHTETSNCPAVYCPINCKGSWSDWDTSCSNLCNSNQQITKTYTVQQSNMHGGNPCLNEHNATITSNCFFTNCPIHCEGTWSSFGTCSNACGESQRVMRTFSVTSNPMYGGEYCKDNRNRILRDGSVEYSNCPFVECSIDCQGSWGGWTPCPTQCIQTSNIIPKTYKYYNIIRSAENDGEACPHQLGDFEESNCGFNYCPIDCLGYWTNWTVCENVSCGDSNHTVSRTYVVVRSNEHNGTACLHPNGHVETSNCAYTPCPINCVGSWGNWSSCSNVCNERSSATREYTITTSNQFGGEECKESDGGPILNYFQTSNCPFTHCPVDCSGYYGDWNEICPSCVSYDSNNGAALDSIIGAPLTRDFNVINAEQYGGTCPLRNSQQTSNCKVDKYCPEPCEGIMREWTPCSTDKTIDCSGGVGQVTTQSYDILHEAQFGGNECEYTSGIQNESNCPINNEHCRPIDCVGKFSEWTPCSQIKVHDCSMNTGAVTTRTYQVTTSNQYGGEFCKHEGSNVLDSYVQTSNCPLSDKHCQPINCVGDWDTWTTCRSDKTEDCSDNSGGIISRKYIVMTSNQYGGLPCTYRYNDGNGINTITFNNAVHNTDSEGLSWGDSNTADWYNVNCRVCAKLIAKNNTTNSRWCQGCTSLSNKDRSFVSTVPGYTQSDAASYVAPVWPDQWTSPILTALDYSNVGMTMVSSNHTVFGTHEYSNCALTTSNHCASIDCEGEWLSWSECPTDKLQNCLSGEGKQMLSQFQILRSNQYGGQSCQYNGEEVIDGDLRSSNCPLTDEHCLPINCTGEWSSWGVCSSNNSEDCTDGTGALTKRTFTVTQPKQFGGADCYYNGNIVTTGSEDFSNCEMTDAHCTDVNCVGTWSEWDTCSTNRSYNCIANQKGEDITRTYTISQDNEFGGINCPHSNNEVQSSNCPMTPEHCSYNCQTNFYGYKDCTQCPLDKPSAITGVSFDSSYCYNADYFMIKAPYFNNSIKTSYESRSRARFIRKHGLNGLFSLAANGLGLELINSASAELYLNDTNYFTKYSSIAIAFDVKLENVMDANPFYVSMMSSLNGDVLSSKFGFTLKYYQKKLRFQLFDQHNNVGFNTQDNDVSNYMVNNQYVRFSIVMYNGLSSYENNLIRLYANNNLIYEHNMSLDYIKFNNNKNQSIFFNRYLNHTCNSKITIDNIFISNQVENEGFTIYNRAADLQIPSIIQNNTQHGSRFTICPVGQFRNLSNTCQVCPSDKPVSDGFGCISCPDGQGANSDKSACVACTNGTKSVNSLCLPCPAGFQAKPLNGMDPNTIRDTCYPCPTGTMAPNEKTEVCQNCPPGKFQDKTGQTSCKLCDKGSWTGSYGTVSCTDCSSGYTTSSTGSTRSSDCTACLANQYEDNGICQPCPADRPRSLPGSIIFDCMTGSCNAGSYFSSTPSSIGCQPCPAGSFSQDNNTGGCTPCPKGTYSSTSGTKNACTPAPPGNFTNSLNSTSYQPCPAGTFSNTPGTQTCTPCPNNKYSTSGQTSCEFCPSGQEVNSSKSGCQPCPPGKFKDSVDGICIDCPAGYYQNETGKSICKMCPTGKYQDQAGQTSCKTCPAGKYQNQTKQTSCNVCPAGEYQDQTGQASCKACPAGKYQNLTGQTSCKACPAGKYQSLRRSTQCIDCPAGKFSSTTGSLACRSCPTGQYQDQKGQLSCKPCGKGKYQNGTGQSACKMCGAGKFQDQTGQSSCKDCPAGKFSSSSGSHSCSLCPVGKYQNETGQSSCKACTAGYYQDSIGQTSCKMCSAGTISMGNGWTRCNNCGDGHVAPPGSSRCSYCERGTYLPKGTFATECLLCPAGKFQPYLGKTECSLCSGNKVGIGAAVRPQCTETCPGGKKPKADRTGCIDCQPGKYSLAGSITCTDCPAGTYSSGSGANYCTNCGAGKYGDQTGLSACKDCPPNKFNPYSRASACTDCPAGKTPNASKTDCNFCPTGQSANPGGGCFDCGVGRKSDRQPRNINGIWTTVQVCVDCPAGTYSEYRRSGSCTDCPAGEVSAPGQTSCTPCGSGTIVSSNNCIACPVNHIPNSAKTSCDPCPKGTYANSGASTCTPCPPGKEGTTSGGGCKTCSTYKHKKTAGNTSCLDCPAGKIPNASKTDCSFCPSGHSANGGACYACPAGKMSWRKNNWQGLVQVCEDCPVGQYQPNSGKNYCNWCGSGTYQDRQGQTNCKQCSMGTFNDKGGQSSCTPCPIGKYQDQTGQRSCDDCPAGTYSFTTGTSICQQTICRAEWIFDENKPLEETSYGKQYNIIEQQSNSICLHPQGHRETLLNNIKEYYFALRTEKFSNQYQAYQSLNNSHYPNHHMYLVNPTSPNNQIKFGPKFIHRHPSGLEFGEGEGARIFLPPTFFTENCSFTLAYDYKTTVTNGDRMYIGTSWYQDRWGFDIHLYDNYLYFHTYFYDLSNTRQIRFRHMVNIGNRLPVNVNKRFTFSYTSRTFDNSPNSGFRAFLPDTLIIWIDDERVSYATLSAYHHALYNKNGSLTDPTNVNILKGMKIENQQQIVFNLDEANQVKNRSRSTIDNIFISQRPVQKQSEAVMTPTAQQLTYDESSDSVLTTLSEPEYNKFTKYNCPANKYFAGYCQGRWHWQTWQSYGQDCPAGYNPACRDCPSGSTSKANSIHRGNCVINDFGKAWMNYWSDYKAYCPAGTEPNLGTQTCVPCAPGKTRGSGADGGGFCY